MKIKLIAWVLLLFPVMLSAANYGNIMLTKGDVLSVINGHTFIVDIQQWQPVVGKNIEIRLRDISTPNIDGACEQETALAVDAKNFVHKLLKNADTIILQDIGRDPNQFRLIADVTVDGVELGSEILEAELGRHSEDAEVQGWCTMRVSELIYQKGIFLGDVLDEIPNGMGTWISTDGQEQYKGEWQEGMWHGAGTYNASDGSINTGEYAVGQRNGQSSWSHPDGRKHIGEYRNDLMHGQGVLMFSNGDVYSGTFENDRQHGKGAYTFSDGSVVDGSWQNGKPWYASHANTVGQVIGQYIDGIWAKLSD